MRLTMVEKRMVAKALSEGYRKGAKGDKGETLDRMVEATGYNRRYAAWLLRNLGKRVETCRGVVFVGDVRTRVKRQRRRRYGEEVKGPLSGLWMMLDYLSGKRPRPTQS